MTGRQVTTSSRSTKDSSRSGPLFRKTSIQTDVSTRTTRCPAGNPSVRCVAPHLRQIPFPEAGSGELENPPCLDALHEVLESAPHGPRERSLTSEASRLGGERTFSRTVGRALEDFVKRIKAGRILELAGSGLWEGDLREMRGDAPHRRIPRRTPRGSR